MNIYENNTTIIIPARNIDFLLKECISKIREIYPVVKINIIIDDFQKNETIEFDENILFIQSINKNMSAKRNLGVKNSNTEYVAFIDSDAYPDKNWLENGCKFLSNNPCYAAVTGNQILPSNDNIERQCLREVRFSRLFTYSQWCKVIDLNTTEQDCKEFMTSNLIMRKKEYNILQGMDENIYLAEDNEFSKRIVANGYKIRFIPQVRVFHHEASFLPFMKKIFSMGKYYVDEMNEDSLKFSLNEKLSMFFPLLGVFLIILLFLLTFILRINFLFNLFIPITVCFIFSVEAINLSKRVSSNKIKLFFMFWSFFVSFCLFYIAGQIAGLLRLSMFKVQEFYKHY